MNTRMIDKMLKILETKADSIHFPIDNIPEYVRVVCIVTADSFNEPITYDDKLYVRNILKDILFPAVGLNYQAILLNMI